MKSTKVTVRLPPALVDAVAHQARLQRRGISNTVEYLLCLALRLPRPRPDHPHSLDARYTARPPHPN